jgi:hypothetical protein
MVSHARDPTMGSIQYVTSRFAIIHGRSQSETFIWFAMLLRARKVSMHHVCRPRSFVHLSESWDFSWTNSLKVAIHANKYVCCVSSISLRHIWREGPRNAWAACGSSIGRRQQSRALIARSTETMNRWLEWVAHLWLPALEPEWEQTKKVDEREVIPREERYLSDYFMCTRINWLWYNYPGNESVVIYT